MRSLEEQERSIPKWGGERGDYIEEKREGEKKRTIQVRGKDNEKGKKKEEEKKKRMQVVCFEPLPS